jgi:hypothetical protein
VCIVRRTRVGKRTARRRAAGREEEEEEGAGEVIKEVGVGKLWTWTSGAHEGRNRRCIRSLSLAGVCWQPDTTGADRAATGAACSRGELFHAFFARFILFSCPSVIESTIHRLLANCGAENGSTSGPSFNHWRCYWLVKSGKHGSGSSVSSDNGWQRAQFRAGERGKGGKGYGQNCACEIYVVQHFM